MLFVRAMQTQRRPAKILTANGRSQSLHLAKSAHNWITKAEIVLYPRYGRVRLEEALVDTPVVLVHGPRQCGKTTLTRVVGDSAGERSWLKQPLSQRANLDRHAIGPAA